MRRGGARHDPRPLRPVGRRSRSCATSAASRATAARPATSCKAARKYGLDAKGYKYEELEKLYDAALPGHPVLELQPLRRPRRVRQGQGLPERSGAGSARGHDGRARRLLLGRRADVQARAPSSRRAASAPSMLPALRRRLVGSEARAVLRRCSAACCWSSRAWSSRPSRASSSTTTWSATRSGWSGRCSGSMAATIVIQAVLTWLQQLLPAAPRDQARARHVEPASSTTSCACRRPTSASASPARSARASPINDKVAKIIGGQARDHRHRQRHDDLLRGADVPLRRQADAGGAAAVGLLNVAAVKAAAGPRTDASRRLMQDNGKLRARR